MKSSTDEEVSKLLNKTPYLNNSPPDYPASFFGKFFTFFAQNTSLKTKFSVFANTFWPIALSELPKFLSITLLMFCILGIQNLIRALKDSVINTMLETETTSFLKFWGVMPAAFFLTIIYVQLVSVMKGEKIFYLVMSVFLGFFALFAFVLFPNYQYLHLNKEHAASLIAAMPHLKWFIVLLSNWSFSLFYIIAELWPNAVYALLFWQFVNKITTIDESKRFYPVFALLGQTGLILSGYFLQKLPDISRYFIYAGGLNVTQAEMSMKITISVVLCLGTIAVIAFWWINNALLDISVTENMQFRVKKNQMSLKESFLIIAESKYIRLIAILLITYGVAINLVEGPWKKSASLQYPTFDEYNAFIGNYLYYTGILTISFSIIGSNLVRRMGWFCAAIVTPIIVFITGMAFFLVANFDWFAMIMIFMFAITDPMLLAINIGAMQNILSKSSKYTLFDSTKEMSYVPLDENLKTRGKAAADVIGTKLGKSLSAFLQSMIFIIFPSASYQSISVILMIVFLLVCLLWIWGVIQLDKEYNKACSKHTGDEMII